MNRGIGFLIVAVVCFIVLLFLLPIYCARAAEGHTHEGAVGKFYQSWMMPDNRGVSCCHDQDCAPAASRLVDGKWEAERDGEWVRIPDQKVETERDSPAAARIMFSLKVKKIMESCLELGAAGDRQNDRNRMR